MLERIMAAVHRIHRNGEVRVGRHSVEALGLAAWQRTQSLVENLQLARGLIRHREGLVAALASWSPIYR